MALAAGLGLVVSLVVVLELGLGLGRESPVLSAMLPAQPLQWWHQPVALVIAVALVILT